MFKWMSAHITSICRVEQNHKKRMYSMYYVNGKKAAVGVGMYVPKTNDIIIIKYENVDL